MGKAACLVILPDQLIGAVVGIACGIRSITDRENITVIVVGIAVGLIVLGAIVGQAGYLSADGSVCVVIAIGSLEYLYKIFAQGLGGADSAESIVVVSPDELVLSQRR